MIEANPVLIKLFTDALVSVLQWRVAAALPEMIKHPCCNRQFFRLGDGGYCLTNRLSQHGYYTIELEVNHWFALQGSPLRVGYHANHCCFYATTP